MTLCPYALVAGCEKCPILKICPLKGVIGNKPKNTVGSKKEESEAE